MPLSPRQCARVLWDGELPGFGLRVEPTGHKSFIVRYRTGGGRTGVLRQMTLGRYGTVTLDEARARARKLLGAAAGGGDPIGDRQRSRQTGLTIAEVCDWYLEQATSGRLLGRHHRPIKASTLRADRSRIERRVKPLIGRRAISALTPRDFEEMQVDVAVHRTPRKGSTGGHGTGGRVLAMMSAILGARVPRGSHRGQSRPRRLQIRGWQA